MVPCVCGDDPCVDGYFNIPVFPAFVGIILEPFGAKGSKVLYINFQK